MKRILITVFLLILVFTLTWVVANRKHVFSFSSIISSYYAKEYCSCRFVVQREPQECHNNVRSWLGTSSFAEDENQKIITVSGLVKTNQARYIRQRHGCRLINPKHE